MLRTNSVIAVAVPLVPLTVIVYVPGVALDIVETVRLPENVGEPELGLNEHEAPGGNPLQERLIGPGFPLIEATLNWLVPDLPCGAMIRPVVKTLHPKSGVLIAYRLLSRLPKYTVPSDPIAGDVSGTATPFQLGKLHLRLPPKLIATRLPAPA